MKQLCGRVDLQIRRFVEGSAKVSDRMRREVLYYVAISAPIGAQTQAVQRAYHLNGLIPTADVLSADVLRVQPLLREARDQLTSAKDLWLKITGGRPENLGKLKQTVAGLSDRMRAIGEPSLSRLVSALASRVDKLGAGPVPESLAMEFATALLLIESTIEHFGTISPELPQQVDAMLARVDAAQQNKPTPPVEAAPLLDEMARRAQERLLLAQVAREIQANLRHMEQVLDAFFRDNSKRADLATLAGDSRQIAGALKMLGLDSAERLLELCQHQIDEYAKPDVPVHNDDLEMLAESLSGLGFYIEAVEQQRPDRERLITPLLDQRLGVAPSAPAAELETVESSVVDLRSALPETFAAFQSAPGDAAARDRLSADLTTLRHDAELIGDARLQQDADAALDQLAHAGTADTAALQDAVAAVAGQGSAAPAPAPSAETMRLLETDATQFDAELLDIYLTEAGEVLDTVAACAADLAAHPDDRTALTVARRGFHTLKGSGRMVGLSDLGELAYSVEKIHNRLLEEDRPATPAVIALIGVAESSFRRWVDALRRTGRVTPDAGALQAALAKVESEFPDAAGSTHGGTPPSRAPAAAPPLAHSAADVAAAAPAAIEVLELDETPYAEADATGGAHASPAAGSAPTLVFGTSPAPSQPAPDAGAHAPPHADAEEEITVGGVTLSAALYRILCEEAKQHLATLDAELQTLQFDPAATPSQLMVRAGHTLCGIHRTGGFPLLATTAKALEVCLLGLQERGPPLPGAAQPVLARAISGLAALSARVRAREPFRAGDEAEAAEIINELETLRAESVPQRALDDSESVAARVAEADEGGATAGNEQPITGQSGAGVSPAERKAAPQLRPAPPATGATASLFATATGPVPAAFEASLLEVHDDVDRQVLPIFLDEAAELFPQTGEQLRAWRAKPAASGAMQALQRTLHTFKGSARMTGAMRLGEVAHTMESRLTGGDAAALSPAFFDALDNDLDHIAFLLDRLQKGDVDAAPPWLAGPATDAPPEHAAPAMGGAVVTPLPITPRAHQPASAARAGPVPAAEIEARAMLRVRAELIDRLVNEAGEVAITRARAEGELRSLKGNLLELTNSVIRLRAQVREIEIQAESQIQSRMSMVNEAAEGFDPLEFDRYTRFQELTRGLAEGVNDVSTVQQSLLKNLDEADAALLAQSRLSRDVQQQLFSIRTVPFGSLSERLYRILRQTAKELDKRANLEIRGTQVELDRSVLEKLVGPLEHLLRNALDHGIESREARAAAGKPETGEISLNVRQQGNEIAIDLADDGAGLDLDRIRDRARAQGLLAADVEPTEAQLIEFIFAPGFSTATKVTQISGRGVGMDVVRSDIAALGGRVEVASAAKQGTSFTLYLPLTLAVAQTVLVKAGGRLWALPSPMVEQVQQIKDKDLINLYLTREVVWQNRKYPFFYLPRLLGSSGHNPETMRHNSVVLLKSGQNLAAVHIDEMIGNQEVVVKNIGPQLARVSGISGATVLGTGEVVLIINPVQLAQRLDTAAEAPMVVKSPQAAAAAAAAAAAEGPPLVMIVDDSLTVRKITSRLLTREGYTVLAAKDGLDALQLLGERTPDVILLDIEMPRMDGFEFAKTIKADANLAHIPIIMITSRTAEKHRNRAAELGVELYLGKPYQEEELLRNLRELLAVHAA
ncbi:MAG TPA: Hpt domain-containing protein [Casimicrobiaceae bacterium]